MDVMVQESSPVIVQVRGSGREARQVCVRVMRTCLRRTEEASQGSSCSTSAGCIDCHVTLLYVPSESNISDWPSRGDMRRVIAETGARSSFMRLPSLAWLTGRWVGVYPTGSRTGVRVSAGERRAELTRASVQGRRCPGRSNPSDDSRTGDE